jgi:hypothetical protein
MTYGKATFRQAVRDSEAILKKDCEQLDGFGQNCDIELRVVSLHVACSIFLTKLFNDGLDRLRFLDRNGSKLGALAAYIDLH